VVAVESSDWLSRDREGVTSIWDLFPVVTAPRNKAEPSGTGWRESLHTTK